MNKLDFMESLTGAFRSKTEEFLSSTRNTSIRLGTLGAKGTTSSMAAEYMRSVLGDNNTSIDIVYYDTFQVVQQNLLDREVEYALVPNAYERVTDFYWDNALIPVLYFIYDTPMYSVYSLPGRYGAASEIVQNHSLKIAACPAVYKLIDILLPELDTGKIQIVQVPSTDSAAKHVSNGLCDLAVTNELCAGKYGLSNVTEMYRVEMSWVVFKNLAKGKNI